MTKEALKLALEALSEAHYVVEHRQDVKKREQAITAIKEALAQREQDGECKRCTNGCPACDARKLPEQEPVAYDKTEMNCFVQDLYDKKMQEGKHGHYETMFQIVHQAIKRIPPQRTWVGLTDEEMNLIYAEPQTHIGQYAKAIQTKLKDKNT